MIRSAFAALLLVPAIAFAQGAPAPAAKAEKPAKKPAAAAKKKAEPKDKWMAAAREGTPLYATIHTNLGDIGLQLFSKDAPKTVENFVGLATGEKEWTHPVSHQAQKKPLYDGVIFHRVIPGFMIQGGDPLGEGFGGPGYKFDDEFHNGHEFTKPGMLAMANAGPNTNGSQFFITVAPTQYLNNHHTIFGEVLTGYDVVEKIAKTPRDPNNDKPTTPVVIKHIDITDKAPASAKAEQKADPKATTKSDKK